MKFSLATPAHEPQLRQLARNEPMPGWIRLAFAHEPDWTASQQVLGDSAQTIVATNPGETVVGCGVRAIRRVYVNGQPRELGYLSGLRSLPGARRALGLAQGYRFLRQLHEEDRRVPAYLTTIVEDNREAIRLLTAERAGLPAYLDQGRLVTSAILLDVNRRTSPPAPGLEIKSGGEVAFDDVLQFLAREGARRQFFPMLERAQLGTARLAGLRTSDFRVAIRAGAIVGTVAAWDQTAFRQVVVTGYSPLLRFVRPALNLWWSATTGRSLPPAGQGLRFFQVAFACARNHDAGVLAALLERLHRDCREAAYDCFLIGFHERNPERGALRAFRAMHYASRLYLAAWNDGRPFCAGLDARFVPHLETATL
jgi:hypothetical protein